MTTAPVSERDEQLAAMFNAAWDEARHLPRVVPVLDEIPTVTGEDVAARRTGGPDEHAFIVHEVAGVPVSAVEVSVTGSGHGEIGWFGTHPDYRGRGHASRNLQAALRFLRVRGALEVRTAGFVDSRLGGACALLEDVGFQWCDADKQNMVMQADLEVYEERPLALPPGYSFATLTPELIADWCAVKDGVFGGETTPEWFARAFGNRWDFDPTGWFLLDFEGQKVGISAADIFRDPGAPARVTGCQIEYVGVLPTHRGKRLGEALVVHCMNYAKRLRAAPLQLITQPFRVPAVTLYESLGFRIVRHNRTYSLSMQP